MTGYNISNILTALSSEHVNCSFLYTADLSQFNITNDSSIPSEESKTLEIMEYVLYSIIIPTVCILGFFGNILNVVVFTKKKTCKALDEMEYCTTICLVALAISDLMFCVCTFPNAFLPHRNHYHPYEFMLYYQMYNTFIISTFILSSTLLTVLTAIMRYVAICHPFHSHQLFSMRKTIIMIIVLAIFSFLFNVPYILKYWVEKPECIDKEEYVGYVQLRYSDLFMDDKFVYVYKLLWAIIGNFIPLSILLYCNICLIRALHKSQMLRLLHSRDNTGCVSAHKRINVTLIAIILLFFILVAPSEITKFIFYISNEQYLAIYTYRMATMVTNTLQTINFSVNFVLYYIIIAPFRNTLHEFICSLRNARHSTQESSNTRKQKKTILHLTHKKSNRDWM
ncbi:hypothetical protein ACJMK2_009155 [Sinanodonta woodiana]|uniref:G-protein coupled receptors family 1 profile domain-containing protein n=1 Tax=Sinanodonta woodiana TaxID=1069815 RepID=A0ABD3VBD7_SINWO